MGKKMHKDQIQTPLFRRLQFILSAVLVFSCVNIAIIGYSFFDIVAITDYFIKNTSSIYVNILKKYPSTEFDLSNLNIQGIALYDNEGNLLRSSGNVPLKLTKPFKLNRIIPEAPSSRGKSLTFIKSAGKIQPYQNDSYLFVSLHPPEPITKNNLKLIITLVSTSLISIFILFFFFYYKKSIRLQKEIESKQHLVEMGQISKMLTHEIKNPLSAIRIQTGYLKRVINEGHLDSVRIIEEETNHLRILTDSIRDYLKDPIGLIELIDLGEFINDVIKRYEWKIELENQCKGKAIVQANPERLRSIFENILNNSIESLTDKQSLDAIKIILAQVDHSISVTIIDKGMGISSENLSRIFEPDFTNKSKGLGLGLSMTKRFLEAIDGKIEITSKSGQGTACKLFFTKKGVA